MTYGQEIDRPSGPVPPEERELDALLEFLHRERGFDFSGYKRSSLMRRVHRRMISVGAASLADYFKRIEHSSDELTELFNVLLINVTAFFRDVAAWEALLSRLPAIVDPDADTPIRVWSTGCSSGEEPYTLAMVLREALGADAFARRVKIFATDIDEDALSVARAATYSSQALEDVPASLVEKYFAPSGDRFTLAKELRRDVVFARHDLLRDAPLPQMDLICCRNLLMYFNPATQERALENLRFALKSRGLLFLGKAEMLLAHSRLFTPLDMKLRLFTPASSRSDRPFDDKGTAEAAAAKLRLLSFDASPIAKIVVDASGRVAIANRRAMQLFPIGPNDIGRPLVELSKHPHDLQAAFERVRVERRFLRLREVERAPSNGEQTFVDVDITPLSSETGALLGMQLTIVDATQGHRLRLELRRASLDLEMKEAELRTAREELEATNHLLQTTNEELETTNEELQAVNEELERMNEELQSTNEELQTMNEELRQRGTELAATSALFGAVLASLRTGVAVLDSELRVLVWNARMTDLFGLRVHEAVGRYFPSLAAALVSSMSLDEIAASLRAALSTKEALDESVRTIDGTDPSGNKMSCEVRIAPLPGDAPHVSRGVIVLVSSTAREVG